MFDIEYSDVCFTLLRPTRAIYRINYYYTVQCTRTFILNHNKNDNFRTYIHHALVMFDIEYTDVYLTYFHPTSVI